MKNVAKISEGDWRGVGAIKFPNLSKTPNLKRAADMFDVGGAFFFLFSQKF